ncbi:Phd finger protein 10 [Fasciola gigantica]|uniref:Phd finger protein 10 n=1 Tax=Fasciola gigantica TaxID=46835 RepID=A0A504YIB3_FASGI|nr:Phd finger protein 10 [Fasciola gigantica]
MSSRYAHLGSGTTTAQHSNPCDTPVIHGGCSTNLLHRLTDRSAYGALVADACEFNRGLSRGRASRLPFVDTATRTTQRPAPWLYRPQCDRFKDAADDGTHIVLRYLRHRWRLDNPPLSRRRKLAADRLWYTLQTSLNGLGVPAELIPVVTQRAYAIAGLPIPPLWANSLDSALSRQAPTSHPNGPFNGTLISSNSAMNSTVAGNAVGVSGRISSSSVPGTMSSKRFSSSVSEPTSTDIGRKVHSRVGVGGADDDSEPVDETATSNDGPISRSRSAANQEESNASLAVVFSGGEESGHSNETGAAAGASSGPLRRSGTSHICPDEETRTDDEAQSVQSGPGGGTVMATRASAAAAKTYDIDPDVESDDDDDDQAGDGDGDDDAEMDDELDDAEWIQPSRRRSTRGFASRRAFNSSRASRALAGSSKSSRFGVSGGRLSGRHIGSGQRTLGGRHKSRNSRAELTGLFGTIATTPSASTSTSSNIAGSGSGSGTVGRRSTRLAVSSTQGAKISSTASGMRDVDKQTVESWDKYDEPGFQPNANLNPLPDRADESHRLLPDPVGAVGTCFAHTRASSLVPGPPVSEGIQLTSESNSQSSSVTTQYMDQSRRHLAATGLSSAIGTSATTTTAGGGNVTASTGSTITGNINGYPLSSTPHSNSASFLSNQKSSTMAQLLASTNNTSSTSAVSIITSSVGASTVPLYDYHNMISTDSNVRESNAHGSEWSAITSSSTSVGPPTKLMKDAVGAPGTPASRSVSDYPSMAEQPSPVPRSTAASSGLTAAAAVGSSSSSGNPAGDPFASPTGATTTVTFFVCEVCASRYRSTAGLRYHYHSQHSGYSPKNPISASASRLVVPVGEERGIGGGLRGGRPRRNKGNTVDARGSRGHKTKDNELKSYGDMILGPLGSVRTGTGDMQTGSNSMDAFKGK